MKEQETEKILLFLDDIQEAINILQVYGLVNQTEFLNNRTLQDAAFFRLQVIGEAVKNIPTQLKQEYSGIPWQKIVGFRNIAAHTYWRIDPVVVWSIISESSDLDDLRRAIIDIKNNLS